jgi:hypothetical protein
MQSMQNEAKKPELPGMWTEGAFSPLDDVMCG